MSTPLPTESRRSSGEAKKTTPPTSNIVTRNGARKAKIQTRAMSAGAKPSAVVVAAKKKAQLKKKQNVDTVLRDHYQIAMDSKLKIKGPTGFVTEPRMAEHRCLWDDNYPECPERLIGVIDRCKELGLLAQCKEYSPRAASKDELSSLHAASIFELMETTHQNQDLEYLEEVSSRFDAVYIHPSTHELALLSAGSTIDMVGRIVSGEIQNGAAFVRPPGHHAMRAEPCGYCFYNNVALAAKRALDSGTNRILIVDWDVHHGQATQQMFYNDPRVVYFSIHRYEHGSFWPNLRHSDFHYVGCGRGKGYTFNVPLNKTGMKDGDYLAIWHQLLLPMAFEYQPELIIISAGYDAAVGCPEGEMEITPACYAHVLNMLMSVCSSVCVVLEGGYCIPSLAEGAALTLRTLLGHPPSLLSEITEPCESIRETILNSIYAHKPYWRCYNYQPTYSNDGIPNVCDREKQKHTVTVKWEGDETRPDRFATRDCYPVQDDETKRRIMERLSHLKIVTDLKLALYPVCYIYDQAMLKHKNIIEPDHVECPERIMRIHERHRDFGLLERVHQIQSRPATDEEITAAHTEKHLNRLKELSTTKLRDLKNQKDKYDSIYFHPDSLESARVAAGSVIQMVDAVLSNTAGSGVCVVRPPGHHADEDTPSGFCLLNNAVLGARYAINCQGARRVLLLDWDVHHGNGTQNLTYDDNKILYISIHRYDDATFFPYSKDADYLSVGEGKGEGFNINIPWNKRGMGDTEYQAAFTQIVLPIAYEYNPDLVIVSAGFDACVGDPLGGCKVSPECYGRMTQLLRSLAGGKVILCLEGGYNITSISYAMTMCTKALLGDPIRHHYDPKATANYSAVESINNVIKIHKKYWKCLKFQLALPVEDVIGEPLPSRGLVVDESSTIADDKSEISLSSTLDNSTKSIHRHSKSIGDLDSSSELQGPLETQLEKLSIKTKCDDGIHCGTDDEDDKSPNTSKKDLESNIKSRDPSKIECITPTCSKTASKCEVKEKRDLEAGDPNCKRTCVEIKNAPESSKIQGSSNQEKSNKEDNKTLVDFLAENMQAIVDGDMFAVIPLPWCPHLESLFAIPEGVKFEQGTKCIHCDHTVENWVCLHCFITACGRSINGHMQAHFQTTSHALVLSLMDLSVWCNVCDSYVDNALLYDAKNNAHKCKFNEEMPWCYRSDTLHLE